MHRQDVKSKIDFPKVERVTAYVDGFNLYFGLNDSNLRHFLWLNIRALAENLLLQHQELKCVRYFTARISGSRKGDSHRTAQLRDVKRKRQSDYLEALGTLPDFVLHEGHFLSKQQKCLNCGDRWEVYEEKMTDVQIATQLLTDAFQNVFDVALLISGDSDLVPPVAMVRRLFRKRVVVCFPPKRRSINLAKAANASLDIPLGVLGASLLPDPVVKPDGSKLFRPSQW